MWILQSSEFLCLILLYNLCKKLFQPKPISNFNCSLTKKFIVCLLHTLGQPCSGFFPDKKSPLSVLHILLKFFLYIKINIYEYIYLFSTSFTLIVAYYIDFRHPALPKFLCKYIENFSRIYIQMFRTSIPVCISPIV